MPTPLSDTIPGNTTMTKKTSRSLPFIICFLAAMFYLYEFILQVSPSVITHEMMRDLSLNAAGLGMVSACYYYAYTPMQLPAGLLYDRYGPRLLLTIAILICAAGSLLFGIAQTASLASTGRFLMGIGSAFSFIGSLVLVSRWFPPKYFALLAGIVQTMSSVGAIAGQGPLSAAVGSLGWRPSFQYLAVIGLLLAAVTWWIVRDRPAEAQSNNSHPMTPRLGQSLKEVCGNSQTWMIGIYAFASWAPITAFAAIWGVPYLSSLYNVGTTEAAAACSMIWLGIGIGSPLIGWWSDVIGRRQLPLTIAALLGVFSLVCILYLPGVSFTMMWVLLFIFGLAASGQSLSFGSVTDNNRPEVVGAAIGFNNMAVVIGGALFQPLVGFILSAYWDGQMAGGAPVYTLQNYQVAMAILPLCYLLGVIISMTKMRETYCRPVYQDTPHVG